MADIEVEAVPLRHRPLEQGIGPDRGEQFVRSSPGLRQPSASLDSLPHTPLCAADGPDRGGAPRDTNGKVGSDRALKEEFARDVLAGLCGPSRKRLPARHLYDSVGSALFEAITRLPEYGLTRADRRLVRRCAPLLADHFRSERIVVAELGSGSGSKTRVLLEGLGPDRVQSFCPIDISSEALNRCARDLSDIVRVRPRHGPYISGVRALRRDRPPGVPMLLLFLGSSIGNFDPQERHALLADIRAQLLPGDRLLAGFDLERSESKLLQAYDDPTGVTAAFNRNVLARVNRELGASFDLGSFTHVARYDRRNSRIEMHLVSGREQVVPVRAIGAVCHLRQGESIWTESSYKFGAEGVRRSMESAGFARLDHWTDDEWPMLEGLWAVDDE